MWGGGGRRLHSESVARDHRRLHTTTDRAVCFGAFPSFNFSPRTDEEVGSQNFPGLAFLYAITIMRYRIKKFNGATIFSTTWLGDPTGFEYYCILFRVSRWFSFRRGKPDDNRFVSWPSILYIRSIVIIYNCITIALFCSCMENWASTS